MQNGKYLIGVAVTPHKLQAVTTLNQIEDYGLMRPSLVESCTIKDRKHDPRLDEAYQMRNHVNRRFNVVRNRRAIAYSNYIEEVERLGQPGGTPAVTLWLPHELESVNGGVIIPYSAILNAIDGETQIEARFLLRERIPETGNAPFAVTLYHGLPFEVAKQVLHDYNSYGVPIQSTIRHAFNQVGALSLAAKAILEQSGIEDKLVEIHKTRPKQKQVLTMTQLLSFLGGYTLPDRGSRTNIMRFIPSINHPASPEVSLDGINAGMAIVKDAMRDMNLRSALPIFWQIAGVLRAQGFDGRLDYEAALAIDKKMQGKLGRGRAGGVQRIEKIIQVMKGGK